MKNHLGHCEIKYLVLHLQTKSIYPYQNTMYTPAKLTEYRSKYNVSWAKQLPDDTPPEDVVVAYDKESLFRLIQEEGVMTEDDLKPHTELYPQRNFGNKLWQASGLSSLCTLKDARSMAKLPFLKHLHGIAEITMCPEYGVMLKTPSYSCGNHYTWWHTTLFDLNKAEIQYREINLQPKAI